MIQINLRVTGMSRLGAALHDLLNPNLGIDPRNRPEHFATKWTPGCQKNADGTGRWTGNIPADRATPGDQAWRPSRADRRTDGGSHKSTDDDANPIVKAAAA